MQIQKKKIKKRIENAAREDFLEYGFIKASMRNIAKKARVSTSNIYNYFKSKDYLFYSLTEPVYEKVKDLLTVLFETEKKLGENEFFKQISDVFAHPVGEIIKQNAKDLIILLDKSEGTKFEKFKENLIQKIESHFTESIIHKKESKDHKLKSPFIMHIIATNLLEGLLEIAKHYNTDEWVDSNIDLLIKYHVHGILSLF